MAEFEELRARLVEADHSARDARQDARTAAIRAMGKNDRRLDAIARAAKERSDGVAGLRAEALKAFTGFTDPRETIQRLDDNTPLLLMPVRLETRFKTVPGPRGVVTNELWVRVYPDDCSVDSFDEVLSVAEVDAARRFWREDWRGGGVEAETRAAWTSLAGGYGGGRAAWIIQAFAPVNAADKPVKNPATDLVLVIGGVDLPPAADRPALATYWIDAWRAHGDAAALNAARFALDGALGAAQAEAGLAAAPFNLTDPPPPERAYADANVLVAWQQLPGIEGEERVGWRRAPFAAALPERFVLICSRAGADDLEAIGATIAEPLYVGPDPLAAAEDQITPKDGKLEIPDPLKWMFDFDAAVAAGMGFRIRLTAEQASRGFDRVMVLGVRMRADADAGRRDFEALLGSHAHSRAGLEILGQGAPTNNSDDTPSAYAKREDPDLAYADALGPPKFILDSDPLAKRDGQVFAEHLGLDPAALQHVRGADGRDAIDARAMNRALAPGTLNYMAGVLMSPIFEGWTDELSWFFGGYVSGRGAIPPLRIGSQPYGIIATTAFSRISWLKDQRRGDIATHLIRPDRQWTFLQRLQFVLDRLEPDWREMAAQVRHVGGGGDPHETLLNILGLHPGSAELHTRTGKHLDELSARAWLARFGGLSPRARAAAQRQAALDLLRSFGIVMPSPDILDLFFRQSQIKLKGPIVETPPLSEALTLQPATTDNRNYLTWLADAANAGVDTLRRQQGFTGDKPPNALLYIMLHFALTRGYQDAGDRLRAESGVYTAPALAELRREPRSVHLVTNAQVSDSPWRRLYQPEAQITGSATLSVADHLSQALPARLGFAVDLAEQIDAVRALAGASTAKLERALMEHVDILSYRFDAWRLGIVRWQLERMRLIGGQAPARQGLYLGAYGWLEDVRPKPRPVTAPDLPPDLAETFKEGPPLVVDPTNGGHLHAPSLNQAVTAAMLRAGDLANPAATDPFAINLSSERVRLASHLLEGVRTGQSVGALLGYRFERALHDAGGMVELDALVFAFRRAFPLTARRLRPTANPTPEADEAIEARNVVDGLKLLKQASVAGSTTYPYGQTLPPLAGAGLAVVEKAVADLKSIFDAMADLVLAEGVHQQAQGAPDRAAAQLEAQADFIAPPDPDVVRTPARGFALTCRVGVELDPAAVAPAGAPPRVTAQPQLDAWLATALPPLNTIGCAAAWTPRVGAPQSLPMTLADLGLSPSDVMHLLADEGGGTSTAELEDRIRRRAIQVGGAPPDAIVAPQYMTAAAGQISVFQASALVKRLRGIALQSRPLRAGDIALPSQGRSLDSVAHVVARSRIADVTADLRDLRDGLAADTAAAQPLLDDPEVNRAALIAGIDTAIDQVVERLVQTSTFGGAGHSWSSLYDWRSERFSTLIKRLDDRLTRWDEALARADQALADEAALPAAATPEERVALLRAAEREVSATLAADLDPVPLRAAVEAARTAFVAKRDAMRASTVAVAGTGVAELLARCQAVLPLDAFDAEPLTFTDVEDSIVAYAEDLQALRTATHKDVAARTAGAEAALTAHDGAADDAGRLKALQTGAEAIFGEGFKLIPTFSLPADFATEQTAAHGAFTSGDLLAYARTALDDPDPLDSWFYGLARVRAKVRMLEDAVMLWEANDLAPGRLNALQLPHKDGAPWLALDFPKEAAPDSERLAYVAFARPGYDPAATRCGLLLDDWAETIPAIEPDEPGPQHTTGVAFHFDRPSQEPPQSMLLLTPAQWDGAWSWVDVTQGVIDTFALARLRAVEPAHLDDTAYAQFLPATVASVTTSGLSLSANFALVNMDTTYVRTLVDG